KRRLKRCNFAPVTIKALERIPARQMPCSPRPAGGHAIEEPYASGRARALERQRSAIRTRIAGAWRAGEGRRRRAHATLLAKPLVCDARQFRADEGRGLCARPPRTV